MDVLRGNKTLIASVAFAILLAAGTAAGCASGSLALQPVGTVQPAPAARSSGPTGPVSSGAPVAGSGPVVQAKPAVVPAPASAFSRAEAAPPTQSTDTTTHGITVNGTGRIQAQPDEAIIQTGVQTRAANAQDAQANNNKTMQAVIDAIKGVGIPEKDIQTSGVSLYPVIEQGNTISGYNATNSVTVTVEKVDQAGAVLDAAVKAGANMAGNVQFTFKDEPTLRNKALAAAAVDARSKADAIAGAMGLKITSVESVSEGSVTIPRPFAAPRTAGAAPAAAPSVPIEPGQQTVTAEVTVVYGY